MFNDLFVQPLESRTLFAGASIANGAIRVYGEALRNNYITVANSEDGTGVYVRVMWKTALGVKKNFIATFPKSLPFSKVSIFGGRRADSINVAQIRGSLGMPTRIDAGAGYDAINTGNERDVIYAGLGNDTVNSGGGNDLVYGGAGDDNLSTGEGNDTVWGGSGDDSIDTGNGDDKLGGVLGTNTLTGGAGTDKFVVTSLSNNPNNDFNSGEDTLVTAETASDTDAPADA